MVKGTESTSYGFCLQVNTCKVGALQTFSEPEHRKSFCDRVVTEWWWEHGGRDEERAQYAKRTALASYDTCHAYTRTHCGPDGPRARIL